MCVVNGINLDDHRGLIFREAYLATERYGGQTEEWVGPAWIAAYNAARTFDHSLGYKFSTHAVKAIRWKLRDRLMYEDGHRRNSTKGKGHEHWRRFDPAEAYRAEQERCRPKDGRDPIVEPLCQHVNERLSGMKEQHRQVADMLARGLNQTEISRSLRLTRSRVQQIVAELREAFGQPKDGRVHRRTA